MIEPMHQTNNKDLPDFLILGGMRCGSTTLYWSLKQHPEIESATTKELHYFNRSCHNDPSSSYYASLFKEKEHKDQLLFEATPKYLHLSRPVVPLVKSMLPNCKFIVLLRNPIYRAYSHAILQRELAKLDVNVPIREILRRYPHILDYGRYWRNLKHWFGQFDRKQFFIINSEFYFNNTIEIQHNICEWLEVMKIAHIPKRINSLIKGKGMKYEEDTIQYLKEYYWLWNRKLFKLLGEEYDWNEKNI